MGADPESRETNPRSEVQETAFNTISVRRERGLDKGPRGRGASHTRSRGRISCRGGGERKSERERA